jgi:hypothetical protein
MRGRLERDVLRPEVAVALAGPLTSFGLAALLWLVAYGVGDDRPSRAVARYLAG